MISLNTFNDKVSMVIKFIPKFSCQAINGNLKTASESCELRTGGGGHIGQKNI